MITVPKGHRCPLCPNHQDDEDDFIWSDLLQAPICRSCTYEIVNGFEGWDEAPTPEQYNHAVTIAQILQLTGMSFQQAKFIFMRRLVEEWSGSVSEEMKGADPTRMTEEELKEWNASLDFHMVQLRLQSEAENPAGNRFGLLDWEDIAIAMTTAFKEWSASDGQEWLKGAWEKIVAAGQANYEDDLEYTEVAVRLIALFDFYGEFCDCFANGCEVPSEETIARALKIEKQNVMLLIGKHGSYEIFFRDRFWEPLFFDGAVSYLCDVRFSEEVQATLLRGCSSAAWLFATLLSSVGAPTPIWWHEDSFDPADDILFGDDCCVEQAGWYQGLARRWQSVNNESPNHMLPDTAVATSPQVGIYFVVQGEVIFDTVSVEQGEPYGEAIEHGGHNDFHEKLTPSTPKERIFKIRPYDYFPRGRVVYFPAPNVFRLYADRCLGPDIQRQVVELFHLVGQNDEQEGDEHYQCARCNRNYLL